MSFQNQITIPAAVAGNAGISQFHRRGKVFACILAGAAFKVRADHRAAVDMATGRAFGNPGAESFDKLQFENTSAAPINVTFYCGDEEYRPDPSLVSANVSVNQSNAATTSQGADLPAAQPVALATNVERAFPDALGKRKQIMVTNRNKPVAVPNTDNPDVLWVLGADGKVMGEIYPQQSYTFEVSGTVTVRNPSVAQGGTGAAVNYMVGEIYYS